jgi:hypothetical protein
VGIFPQVENDRKVGKTAKLKDKRRFLSNDYFRISLQKGTAYAKL